MPARVRARGWAFFPLSSWLYEPPHPARRRPARVSHDLFHVPSLRSMAVRLEHSKTCARSPQPGWPARLLPAISLYFRAPTPRRTHAGPLLAPTTSRSSSQPACHRRGPRETEMDARTNDGKWIRRILVVLLLLGIAVSALLCPTRAFGLDAPGASSHTTRPGYGPRFGHGPNRQPRVYFSGEVAVGTALTGPPPHLRRLMSGARLWRGAPPRNARWPKAGSRPGAAAMVIPSATSPSPGPVGPPSPARGEGNTSVKIVFSPRHPPPRRPPLLTHRTNPGCR